MVGCLSVVSLSPIKDSFTLIAKYWLVTVMDLRVIYIYKLVSQSK